MYKLTEDSILKIVDGTAMSIPRAEGNRHYQEFLDYVIEHGVADIDGGEEVVQEDYATLRAAAYPSIPDQLDMIYNAGEDAWRAAIKAIKDKYPKTMQRETVAKPVPAWVLEEANKKAGR